MASRFRIGLAALLVVGISGVATPESVRAGGGEEALDLRGHWEGAIALPSGELRVMVDFARAGAGEAARWSGTIDIPAQSAHGLALAGIVVEGFRARFSIAGVPGSPTFDGVARGGEIRGDFTQGAARLAFRLGREPLAAALRPQDPRPPLPYREEDVTYASEGTSLAGTLTLPAGAGPFPAAILVSGSGPQNRDEEIFDHRPFLVLADALARRGIAVLRSDDRGVGASGGDPSLATTADLADDALAAVEFAAARPEIDAKRVGIVGHSEGGLIGPLAASRSTAVAYVVMLAGPAVPGAEILPTQNRRLAEAAGGDPATVDAQIVLVEEMIRRLRSGADASRLRPELTQLALRQLELAGEAAREALGDDPEGALAAQIERLLTPWFRYFLDYDPRPALRNVRVPVLALNGELDLQVDADQNLPEIERALDTAGNDDFTIQRLPGLNHLFQHATTGAVAEYGRIEETMAPEVLALIGDWITQRFAVAVGPG